MSEMTQEHIGTGIPQLQFKDRIFRMLFGEKKDLLSLYNAMSGTHYQNPEELEINTLENVIYMGMRNDLSFLIHCRLPLYEHQSTYNPNMPLRNFFYSASLYSKLTTGENLYGHTLVKIPTPQFVVFYNGEEVQPERKEMLLSDAFAVQESEKSLELKVMMLNINSGYNEALKAECKTLRDYVHYVEKVRGYTKQMPLEDAVESAIVECIAEGVMVEFLRSKRAEVKIVSIFEYDEELHLQQEREAAREDGWQEGLEQARQEAISRMLNKLSAEDVIELGYNPEEVYSEEKKKAIVAE